MTVIAKGAITLTNLNDALAVRLTPSTCVIRADYDGSNPALSNAYTDVTVARGESLELFTIQFVSSSNAAIQYEITDIGSYTKRIALTNIPTNILSGELMFIVTATNASFSSPISFQFTVLKDGNMLDWINDWESNKTVIGSTYLITPKIFVGKKVVTEDDLAVLCGVYIGPDNSMNNSAGLYGYYEGRTIFQLNKDGGMIGGWTMTAKYLYNAHVMLDSLHNCIGVNKQPIDSGLTSEDFLSIQNETYRQVDNIIQYGGVYLNYESDEQYGLSGYLPAETVEGVMVPRLVFTLGNANMIAGWNFDEEALWIGTKNNTLASYAEGITIGTNGIRGVNWYIDNGGEVSFVNGWVNFGTNAQICGWVLSENSITNPYIVLSSHSDYGGLYLSPTGFTDIDISLYKQHIAENGGVYLTASPNAELVGYIEDELIFKLSSIDESQISAWKFNASALYIGEEVSTGFTSATGDITIGKSGIRGFKWRLESDGSGELAGGKISWKTNGSGSLAGGQISWDSSGVLKIGGDNGTIIQNDHVLTGSIIIKDSEGVIKAGIYSSGSGNEGIRFFAGGETEKPFYVTETGFLYANNVDLEGVITATGGYIGNWMITEGVIKSSESTSSYVLLDADSQSISLYNDNLNVCLEEIDCGGIANSKGGYSSHINLSASTGMIKVSSVIAVGSTIPKTYMSPYGVYANFAGVKALETENYVHVASVIGLGIANKTGLAWNEAGDENCVVGVYGKASNRLGGPAYGGYFENLKACGLVVSRKIITDSASSSTQILPSESLVIGTANTAKAIVLPNDAIEGRVVIVQQLGNGALTVSAPDGQFLGSPFNANTTTTLNIGESAMFMLTACVWDNTQAKDGSVTTSELKYVWTINKFANA